jgi:transaldolase / glucose-6-phosphate isomerase
LVIVSTKSGGTVETISMFKSFWNWIRAAKGKQDVGNHFVAITDPNSSLAALAQRYQFRSTFVNDPNLGGRYSGLSFFGLVPAALVDVNVPRLLDRAQAAARECGAIVPPQTNPGAHLGAILYALAEAGRDKVTFITAPELASFGDWVEQLIAESTGKQGHGLVPVVGEPTGAPSVYGSDRLFVHLYLDKEPAGQARAVAALEAAGHPVLRMRLHDCYDIGAQFLLWEMATALVCSRWKINAFDQPDVESAKVVARDLIKQYLSTGGLPAEVPAWKGDGVAVYTGGGESIGVSGEGCADPVGLIVEAFLRQAVAGSYVAIQAYLQPTARTDAVLLALREAIRDRSRLAVTTGYGPRFLHSTGQLHKGDAGHGLFLQITADPATDVAIPDLAGEDKSSVSFGILISAQALGDWGALRSVGRRTLRLHLSNDVQGRLESLARALSSR